MFDKLRKIFEGEEDSRHRRRSDRVKDSGHRRRKGDAVPLTDAPETKKEAKKRKEKEERERKAKLAAKYYPVGGRGKTPDQPVGQTLPSKSPRYRSPLKKNERLN